MAHNSVWICLKLNKYWLPSIYYLSVMVNRIMDVILKKEDNSLNEITYIILINSCEGILNFHPTYKINHIMQLLTKQDQCLTFITHQFWSSTNFLLILKSLKGRDVSFFEFWIGTGWDTAQPAVRFIPFPLLYISICSVSWCLLFSCTEMNFIRNEYKMSKIDYKTY